MIYTGFSKAEIESMTKSFLPSIEHVDEKYLANIFNIPFHSKDFTMSVDAHIRTFDQTKIYAGWKINSVAKRWELTELNQFA